MTRALVSLAAIIAACPCGAAAAGEPNLQPVIERMSAASSRDRVAALRDFARLKPSPGKARPVLDKVAADASPEVRAEAVVAVTQLLGAAGTDLLEKLYGDSDHVVRDAAIRETCRLWDQERPRVLCQAAFGNPDYGARVTVLTVLRETAPRDPLAVELFRKGLADSSELVQRAAVYGVQAARDERAVADLGRLARTADDIVAVPAAEEALATIGNAAAVQELIGLLERPKPAPGAPARPGDLVRAAAAGALGRVKDARALPRLRELLADPNPALRIAAMSALTAMRDRASVPLLVPHLQDREQSVRLHALRAVRQVGDRSCTDAVRQVLRNEKDPAVRASALTALADLAGAKAIPDLAAARSDPAHDVRLEAASDLAAFGRPAADALAAFLKDDAPEVRKMAIQGLGQIGGPENIPAIAAAASDASRGNLPVRMAVAEALGAIHHADAVPALARLAADPEAAVRQAAASALGQVGGDKARAILEGLLQDAVPSVRSSARRAMDAAGRS